MGNVEGAWIIHLCIDYGAETLSSRKESLPKRGGREVATEQIRLEQLTKPSHAK